MNSNPTAIMVNSIYKPVRILGVLLLGVVLFQAVMMYLYSTKVKNEQTAAELAKLSYIAFAVVITMGYLIYKG